VAFFMLRHSQLTDDAFALVDATRWMVLAERDLSRAGALAARGSQVFPDGSTDVESSLYYGEPGIWCIAALVFSAEGDDKAAARAVDRFVAITETCSRDEPDVLLGTAGLLVGTAALVEELDGPPVEQLIAAGERLATGLATTIAQNSASVEFMAAGHGWCGIAHALLRWCQVTEASPPPPLIDLIERLRAAQFESGLWPRREGSPEIWRGWCRGSAGWVQLWTLAHEVLGDGELLAMTERAARHAVAAGPTEPAGLCCGQAGEGYAALAMYRATSDGTWLDHAHRLVVQASLALGTPNLPDHSLWRGDLGLALLATELSQPDRAAMPLYRAIGSVTV
jgi:serine/threonine-protein kinase